MCAAPAGGRGPSTPDKGNPKSSDLAHTRHALVELQSDLDVSGVLLAFWIDRLSRQIASWRLALCKEAGLDPTEAHILIVLRIQGEPPKHAQTWLRQTMRLTSGGITRAIDRMLSAGTLITEASVADRRSMTLHLTPKGREAADRLLQRMSDAQAERLGHIPEERRADLLAALEELAACYADTPLPS